ncbi:MAG: hypothetical protein ACPG7F_17450 [Aggregatilineales bacterium]
MSAAADLQHWLKQATKGLPADDADRVRDELLWHYEDARDAYLSEGMTPDAAHQAVMADLGIAKDVATGFKVSRYASRRYLWIAIPGLLYPFMHLLLMQLHAHISGTAVFNLVIFLPLLYVVYGFKTLLAERPHGANLKLYEQVIHTGIVLACVPRLLAWLIYHRPMVIESYGMSLWDTHTQMELVLNLMTLTGFFILAAGLLSLGERVLHLHESLYGLLKPAAVLAIGCGVIVGIYAVASMMGHADLSLMADYGLAIVGMIAVVLWSFIFFRARTELLTAAI